MIDVRVEDLLKEVGLAPSPGVEATIVGRDPVEACRFPVGEASAVALAACGVAVSNLWELKGGRPQRGRVEVAAGGGLAPQPGLPAARRRPGPGLAGHGQSPGRLLSLPRRPLDPPPRGPAEPGLRHDEGARLRPRAGFRDGGGRELER